LRTLGHDNITFAEEAISALEAAAATAFDVIFLDIEMGAMNGIDLGYELQYRGFRSALIFQTAYSDHALDAFDIGAVGYLVKPYSIEQLEKTLGRVTQQLHTETDEPRIMSRNGDNYYLLRPEDIYYIKADLSEVMLRTKKGFSYVVKKISDLETVLSEHHFVRVHRSYLINLDHIKEMETIEQSKIRFSFEGINDTVESSKDGAKHFRNRFS